MENKESLDQLIKHFRLERESLREAVVFNVIDKLINFLLSGRFDLKWIAYYKNTIAIY